MANEPGAQYRFALSFTSGGLLAREAFVVASIYLDCHDWQASRRRVVDNNVLQARTLSSNNRLARETIQRLAVLTDNEIELLTEASLTERCHLMWAAACRRYELIGDFAEEVVRERFLLMTPTLAFEDYERFMTGKSLWHPELDELRPSTRAKLRQNMFRMLHEAGLCGDKNNINPVVLSDRIHETLAARSPSDLRFFPTTTPIAQFNNEVQQ